MSSRHSKELDEKKYVILVISIIAVIALLVGILGYKIWKDKNISITSENTTETNIENNTDYEEEKKEINIYKGTERPIAVMIDNHKGAWPQSGLNKAYMVYEIIVEGGETRLMALFKGTDVENIGPVRSSRHYFLDYAMENDAIYVHYGWSPKAKKDISTYSINNINGINYGYGKSTFWRISSKKAPHNAMTSTNAILSMAKDKGYRTTSEVSSVLNYVEEEVNLDNGLDATEVTIPHSSMQKVKYVYDENTNKYTRYARGTLQKDLDTGKAFTTKNIIIEFIDNSVLNDGTGKDRQNLSNIGTFNGYYITNGKAIKIKCTKDSRTSKTEYKDENGQVINVNDGNTWVNICPKDAKVVIE